MTHLGMSGHKLNKICGVIIIITILTHNTKKKTLGGVATKSMKSAASVAVLLIRRSMGFMATMRSSSMSSLCEGAGNGMSTSTLGPEGGYIHISGQRDVDQHLGGKHGGTRGEK